MVGRIGRLPSPERETALGQLMILAGLRRLSTAVAQEVQKMPIYIDIRENEVLGPMYERAVREGELKGELQRTCGVATRVLHFLSTPSEAQWEVCALGATASTNEEIWQKNQARNTPLRSNRSKRAITL